MTSQRSAVSMQFSRKAEVVLVGMVCLFEPSRDRFGQRFRERIFEKKKLSGMINTKHRIIRQSKVDF